MGPIDLNLLIPGIVTPLCMLGAAWLGFRNKVRSERVVVIEGTVERLQRELEIANHRIERCEASQEVTRQLLRVCEESRLNLLERLANVSSGREEVAH